MQLWGFFVGLRIFLLYDCPLPVIPLKIMRPNYCTQFNANQFKFLFENRQALSNSKLSLTWSKATETCMKPPITTTHAQTLRAVTSNMLMTTSVSKQMCNNKPKRQPFFWTRNTICNLICFHLGDRAKTISLWWERLRFGCSIVHF